MTSNCFKISKEQMSSEIREISDEEILIVGGGAIPLALIIVATVATFAGAAYKQGYEEGKDRAERDDASN